MKGGKRPPGYTIIEVMIVLAVSGVMFIIAATFISGKEARTAFTEGTNDFNSQLQSIISQVVDGQFSDVALTCTAGAGLSFNTGAAEGGTAAPCVFVGKFLHFSENGDPNKYEVFSLAGGRNVTSLTGPPPVTPVAPPYTAGAGADLTLQQAIPQGLTINSAEATSIQVTDSNGVTHDTYGFGFVQSLGTTNGAGEFNDGAQTVGLVYSSALGSKNLSENAAAGAITGSLLPATSATICLTDGTRFAEILVGGTASQLTATVQVVRTC